jgi:carboxymethylenebutenolidase
MGQRVEFPSNAHTCQGYLATPQEGPGPAVVVIQEWWGLVEHIEDVVDRFAGEGFLAIAPDLYHGKTTKSPDEAGRLVMELDAERALTEIKGAGAYLLGRPECSSKKYGVVGFCVGGGLAKYAATKDEKVGAAVSFYGGFKRVTYDWQNLHAPILLFAGENDKGLSADGERELAERLIAMGKNAAVQTYPNADHAFFNDTRPQVYNAAAARDSWARTLDFFRGNLR